MPKMKTNRGAAKRFKKTASGGFKRGHAFHSHILTKKDQKRKRGLRGTDMISDSRQEICQTSAALRITGGSGNGTSKTWCNRARAAQEGP